MAIGLVKSLSGALILFFATSVNANDIDVDLARNELSSSLTKLVLLSVNLTHKGDPNPNVLGAIYAAKITEKLDAFVGMELQKNSTCLQIKKLADENYGSIFQDEKLSPAGKRAEKNVRTSISNYTSAQCTNLTE